MPTDPRIALQQQIQNMTSQSVFREDGKIDEERARHLASKGDIYLGEYLHLNEVPWAPDPDGSDHCIWLSRIVEYIAQLPGKWGGVEGGPLSTHDVKVLHAVAMLYCTGRQVPSFTDPNIKDDKIREKMARWEERSAANAELFLREGGGAGTYWSKSEVREDVCKLIYHHRRAGEVRIDKRLQVFNDAVLFETARYFPNTGDGLRLLRERVKAEAFFTGWGKDKENFRAWMIARGWK